MIVSPLMVTNHTLVRSGIVTVSDRASAGTYDDYHQNRTTDCFIVIDETTGQTAGAGMLLSPRS